MNQVQVITFNFQQYDVVAAFISAQKTTSEHMACVCFCVGVDDMVIAERITSNAITLNQ